MPQAASYCGQHTCKESVQAGWSFWSFWSLELEFLEFGHTDLPEVCGDCSEHCPPEQPAEGSEGRKPMLLDTASPGQRQQRTACRGRRPCSARRKRAPAKAVRRKPTTIHSLRPETSLLLLLNICAQQCSVVSLQCERAPALAGATIFSSAATLNLCFAAIHVRIINPA